MFVPLGLVAMQFESSEMACQVAAELQGMDFFDAKLRVHALKEFPDDNVLCTRAAEGSDTLLVKQDQVVDGAQRKEHRNSPGLASAGRYQQDVPVPVATVVVDGKLRVYSSMEVPDDNVLCLAKPNGSTARLATQDGAITKVFRTESETTPKQDTDEHNRGDQQSLIATKAFECVPSHSQILRDSGANQERTIPVESGVGSRKKGASITNHSRPAASGVQDATMAVSVAFASTTAEADEPVKGAEGSSMGEVPRTGQAIDDDTWFPCPGIQQGGATDVEDGDILKSGASSRNGTKTQNIQQQDGKRHGSQILEGGHEQGCHNAGVSQAPTPAIEWLDGVAAVAQGQADGLPQDSLFNDRKVENVNQAIGLANNSLEDVDALPQRQAGLRTTTVSLQSLADHPKFAELEARRWEGVTSAGREDEVCVEEVDAPGPSDGKQQQQSTSFWPQARGRCLTSSTRSGSYGTTSQSTGMLWGRSASGTVSPRQDMVITSASGGVNPFQSSVPECTMMPQIPNTECIGEHAPTVVYNVYNFQFNEVPSSSKWQSMPSRHAQPPHHGPGPASLGHSKQQWNLSCDASFPTLEWDHFDPPDKKSEMHILTVDADPWVRSVDSVHIVACVRSQLAACIDQGGSFGTDRDAFRGKSVTEETALFFCDVTKIEDLVSEPCTIDLGGSRAFGVCWNTMLKSLCSHDRASRRS